MNLVSKKNYPVITSHGVTLGYPGRDNVGGCSPAQPSPGPSAVAGVGVGVGGGAVKVGVATGGSISPGTEQQRTRD